MHSAIHWLMTIELVTPQNIVNPFGLQEPQQAETFLQMGCCHHDVGTCRSVLLHLDHVLDAPDNQRISQSWFFLNDFPEAFHEH